MKTLNKSHECRLFLDSLQLNFKSVLLHIGNELPLIPIGHSVHMKKTYSNMKLFLDAIKYGEFEWQVVISKCIFILLGMQLGFKFCYFFCE